MHEPHQSQTESDSADTARIKNSLADERPLLHTATLMEIFRFGESALQTNRSGFITQQQKQVLIDDLKNDADAMWLILMIMLVASVVVGAIMNYRGLPMTYLVFGAGALIAPLLWYAYTRQTRTKRDLARPHVRSVQGQASVYRVGQGTNMRARLRVQDMTFQIGLHEGRALEEYDLGILRVYYAEHSQVILAAEALANESGEKLKLDEGQYDEDLDLDPGSDLAQRKG